MASIHRQPGKPFFFCAFTTPDGKRRFKSTKTADKKQAAEICRGWEKATRLARSGKLTPERAREVIAEGVANVFAASGDELPHATIRAWCERWLAAKEIETETTTHSRYKGIVARFLDGLDQKANRDLSALRTTEIQAFRDGQARELSRASANLGLKILRVCFGGAVRQGLLTSNPAALVATLRGKGEGNRRPLTLAEIKRLLAAAKGAEMEGLILFGLYTGQRLGDLARMTWRAVDLEKREIAFSTRKTRRRMILPLLQPLADYVEKLPSTDDPDTPIFPQAAAAAEKSVGTLSNWFHDLLVNSGLAERRTHQATKEGRGATRETSELSFHSLRHSATTFLKAAGVSDSVAMEIIGHDSAAISRGYTHLSTDDLRRAMDKLPDVTGDTK
ncbi:MAG: site-specific integrase [Verrucomicrobia bacterium]|nr:site-specific integrase [Verrucomicrobiota bacterium]